MALGWLVFLLATTVASVVGPARSECVPGTFWKEECNTCWCMEGRKACTLMRCPPFPLPTPAPESVADFHGPPKRPGVFNYVMGRSAIVPRLVEASKTWECHWGSSWIERNNQGCFWCHCPLRRGGAIIECEPTDSMFCKDENSADEENEVLYRRRRESEAAASPVQEAPAPAAESPAAEAPAAESPSAEAPVAGSQSPPAAESPDAETATAESPLTESPNAAPTDPPIEENTIAPATASVAPPVAALGAAPAAAPPAAPAAAPAAAPVAGLNGTQAATTAPATVVKERSCKSGSTWEEECNTCWCLDNGMAACTTNRCGESAAPSPLALGAPQGAPQGAPKAPQGAPQVAAQGPLQAAAQDAPSTPAPTSSNRRKRRS